jgi:Ser/Thr protein kinase RdoA (MazF antagonist)
MKKFPVTSSILSADHIGIFVKKKYGLIGDMSCEIGDMSCEILKAGINHSYLVKDKDQKFIFRLYSFNWRSDLEINEEIRLLEVLMTKSISVSYPLKDIEGNYIQYLEAPEGMRQGVLFSFAEGEKNINFSADLHFKVGQIMANIHKATLNLELKRINYTAKLILEDSLASLSKFLPADSEEMAWMLSTQEYLSNEMNKADTSQLRKGAVHLDIWFDNMNITRDGKITIFDFDFCGNGWLCYDIAYYVLQLHSTERDIKERNLKVKSFIDGYQSVTRINDEERRLLPVLGISLYFFYLGVQCKRYNNWSNVFLNEAYLKRFINLLVRKYFEENVVNTGIVDFQET